MYFQNLIEKKKLVKNFDLKIFSRVTKIFCKAVLILTPGKKKHFDEITEITIDVRKTREIMCMLLILTNPPPKMIKKSST